jgi:cobalt-zinc-cadmium efflux system outer membrane protein
MAPVADRLPSINSSADSLEHHPESMARRVGDVVMASATQPCDEPRAQSQLAELVSEALAVNPEVRRMEAEAAAAWERVPQVRSLPDPMVQATGFAVPQFMADGEMWATFMISQEIPYFKQLDARGQQAAYEAMMLQQETQSARLRIIADVEEAWYRLYLLGQLLRINEANRQLITPLVEVATGRVEVGETSPGDVVLGTLELSRVEEERLMFEQQLASRKAALNQLLNRPADTPILMPDMIDDPPIGQSLDELRAVAFQRQPEIVEARLRTEATAWGVRVARWERVPEVAVLYEHMFMEMNPGQEGPNPQRVGVEMNLPLWRRKYLAMEREARQENLAAHRGVEEAIREYDSMLLDLLEQARTAERTAQLYRNTILPQSRQALEVDQRAYGQGTVTFERVIGDARNLLTAHSAFHRAMTDRAIAVARLKQAVGGQLPATEEELQMPALLPTLVPDE